MRPHLLAPGTTPQPATVDDAVVEDLRLDAVRAAMARGDEHLAAIVGVVLRAPLTSPAVIAHRQDVLADCLRAPGPVRALHQLAADAVAREATLGRGMATRRPEGRLRQSLRSLELAVDHLRALLDFTGREAARFTSAPFTRLFATIRANVDSAFLREVAGLVERLRFDDGILATARLGAAGSTDFRVYEPSSKGRTYKRLRRSKLTYSISAQEEQDWRAMAFYRDRVLAGIAHGVGSSADQVTGFFRALHDELAFYVGCLNLADSLAGLGAPVCLPRISDGAVAATGLRDPSLLLGGTDPVVGNDISADGARLIMVTGANRGGKTTFLRSIGAAQLMAQCGMFVCAREFTAPIATGVHTHFRRTEDRAMVSGKLDEELARMSAIADRLTSGALVLCNESFMSTNDREGAEIAAEILRALTDLGVRVVFVTHLHTLAQRFHADRAPGTVFLTADASRSFRLAPGTPSPTAHAADLARRFLGRS